MSGGGGGEETWRKVVPGGAQTTAGAGGPAGGASDPCAIVETTAINSPDRAILGTLRIGDLLAIELVMGPPRRLVARASVGIAGSITSPSLPQLIQCMQAGNHYVAEVLALRGAVCQVRVRRQ